MRKIKPTKHPSIGQGGVHQFPSIAEMLLAMMAAGEERMGSLQGYPCLSRWSTAMYLQAAQVDSVDFKEWESEGREGGKEQTK